MAYITEAHKEIFLDALRDTCNVTLAAKAAGFSSGAFYQHRQRDPLFAERWQEAEAEGVDLLEAEAHRRAFEGNDEPVFYKGMECGYVRKYSDSLTMFLLKAHRPDKYRERSEVKQELSGGLNLDNTARAARLSALMELARRRKEGQDPQPDQDQPENDASDLV